MCSPHQKVLTIWLFPVYFLSIPGDYLSQIDKYLVLSLDFLVERLSILSAWSRVQWFCQCHRGHWLWVISSFEGYHDDFFFRRPCGPSIDQLHLKILILYLVHRKPVSITGYLPAEWQRSVYTQWEWVKFRECMKVGKYIRLTGWSSLNSLFD